jgi:uncharacterized protein YfeS
MPRTTKPTPKSNRPKLFRHAALGLLSFAFKTMNFVKDTIVLNWRLRNMTPNDDDNERYGIDRDYAHPRALEVVPDDFFWDCVDELAPFGSDEGDTALDDFRQWRSEHPKAKLTSCLRWVVAEVGEMKLAQYSDRLLDRKRIAKQMADDDFDSDYFIYTLDASVIGTAFGQLADEGRIDADAKPYAEIALRRQIIFAELSTAWPHREERISILQRLLEVLAACD